MTRSGRGPRGPNRNSPHPPRHLLRSVALVIAIVGASFTPIWWPHIDPPAPADAVFVLSGDHGERLPIAMSLLDGGLVSTLVFVGTPDRLEEDQLCRSRPAEFVCLRPQPDNTRTEAQEAARLAEARQWRSVTVVTSKDHITRARILFRRCFNGRIRMMGDDPPPDRGVLPHQPLREWVKVAYTVTLSRSC